MGLPRVIEYLLTIEKPGGGGYLVSMGGNQIEIPVFPPNSEISLNFWPYAGDFANIVFHLSLDPALIPRAFYIESQYYGSKVYTGVASQSYTLNPTEVFLVTTQSQPAYSRIRNQSPLNQYYLGTGFFLCVESESDFYMVKEKVKEVAASGESLELQGEANRLLKALAGEPHPPLGGS